VPYDPISAAKGNYRHFMLKEIMEQPSAVLDTIRGRTQFEPPAVILDDFALPSERLRAIRRVVLLGMGTSLRAAMIGRGFIEQIAGVPAEFDNASEFRYREPLVGPDTLVIAVAQSGETVDTLAAMGEAKRRGSALVAVCNVVGSQATRVADAVVYTRCGPEIGVASTKTLLGAITALYQLACYLGQERGTLTGSALAARLDDLARMPQLVGEALSVGEQCERIARSYHAANDFLFLGRGVSYPVALEGALKLKEISYVHAEGYPAGEMKHGPIALIDRELPVVIIAPRDGVYEKTLSNIEEVRARDGQVIAIGTEGDGLIAGRADHAIFVPAAPEALTPMVTLVPLQFLAYHIALRRGCDVDQPRNLAKTVTVE
jgi:glucosamine--fructose-6-phosphate aminotransferase (isomerizing)